MRHPMSDPSVLDDILSPSTPDLLDVATTAPGPEGRLPITAEILNDSSSGDLFALSQNIGMG